MAEVLTVSAELSETVPRMVSAALAVSAGKMHLDSVEAAEDRLRAGDPAAVDYFRYALARETATLLLSLDEYVVAIYEEQDVPAGEELAPAEVGLLDPLRIYLLVERDTAALAATTEALDRALTEELGYRFRRSVSTFLDPIVVEESQAHRLRPRAYGYRPAPALILSREMLDGEGPCSLREARSWR